MSRADRCLHHSLAHLRCDRPSRRCKITRSSSRTRNRTMQLTYLEAIRQGIWEEMEKDPTVFCIRGGAHRHASCRRVSVYGFHWLCLQPDCQYGCEGSLSLGSASTAGDSRPEWRQCAWWAVSLAESGDVVRARARAEGSLPGGRIRRQGTNKSGHSRQ